MADFRLENTGGSLVLLRPLTVKAEEWLAETAPDDAQFLGRAMAIEPRFVQGVVDAAENDGFDVDCG